ncbi:YchJ family protein [Deinococcus aquiradiocola]|uniref:UPF0225 protein GCM10008939_02950 n=1 Tax=Deinococcus aquiradiocola TaxID=393059 RepID=A0A917P5H0_9DEIO|nr:YchJ family protein [Deinococcus aquiradiocola]GGJ62517.1 UPF0225 protein [Deinococcus aquiradiocola]
MSVAALCPCGSGRRYAACCGTVHSGARPARTAEILMRSRYSAYVLRLEAYLLHTWHPATRPERLDLQDDPARWLGLTVRSTRAGGPQDDTGEVSFTARYRVDGESFRLDEDSRFVRLDGSWVYLDGEGGTGAR